MRWWNRLLAPLLTDDQEGGTGPGYFEPGPGWRDFWHEAASRSSPRPPRGRG